MISLGGSECIILIISNFSNTSKVIFSWGIFISLWKCLDVHCAGVKAPGQDAFSASGANGTIISCNKENQELDHKISKEFLEELNSSKAAKRNNFHGMKMF